MGKLQEITGLWKHKDKNGKTYLTAKAGNERIFIFENQFKERGTNQPDFFLYLTNTTIGNSIVEFFRKLARR